MDIPNAKNHRQIEKSGYLQKLSGRSFPYLHQWRRRYCVLAKGILFYYEKDDSKGTDKASGAIDLKYFDQVTETPPKEAKKATNAFVITSQDRSFFDPGRYLFSADTLTDMNDWVNRIRESFELIKNNNRPLRKEPKCDQPSKGKGNVAPFDHIMKKKDPLPDEGATLDTKRFRKEKVAPLEQKQELPKRLTLQNNEIAKVSIASKAHKKEAKLNEDFSPQKDDQQPGCSKELKPLESITKYRAKGPRGRRAPQSRRNMAMKQRASSLSALQHDNRSDEAIRENERKNRSSELLEEEINVLQSEGVNTSHPALAYRYSSDEDSVGEDILSDLDGFLGMSASALNGNPPSPPPRLYSLNNDVPTVIPGDSRRNSAILTYQCDKVEDLLDYRSLPRANGRKSSGRTSPAMDALENHLMNQSIHHIAGSGDICSDPESSSVSTFKGTQKHNFENENKCPSKTENLEDFSTALIQLSAALEHTQQHIAALDKRTKSLERDVKTVVSLPSSANTLRSELDRLTESIAFVSQESARARIDLLSQRQETERAHHEATSALADAVKTKHEMQNTKMEYESLVKELHSLITSIKTTVVPAEHSTDNNKLKHGHTLESKETQNDTSNEKSKLSNTTESKKVQKENGSKIIGYQSFFQRPTSLIYGLTSRGVGKSVSFGDKDKKEKEKQALSKLNNDEKKKVKTDNLETKQRTEKQSIGSEKKVKASRRSSEPKNRRGSADSASEKQRKLEREAIASSIDDFPMMDDQNSDILSDNKSKTVAFGISHVSINVSPPTSKSEGKFVLEKSLSSPVVPNKSSLSSRSGHLNIPGNSSRRLDDSNSRSPSPDSPRPTRAATASSVERIARSSSREENRRSSDSPFVSTNQIAPSKPGVFAISRQCSSPNLPLHRQSSTGYPIQRQHSLGTVPEESHLPRQASLMSVPEDRPIADRTLPLSPTASMISFPLSPSPSDRGLNGRNSMELVTGPVISGSSFQEASTRQLPPASGFHGAEIPVMTSSLKKDSRRKRSAIV